MSVTPAEKRRFFDELAPRWDSLRPAQACAPGVERGLALVGPLEGRCVVDLGCGTGLLEEHVLPRIGDGRVVAVDFSAEMLALARARHVSDRIHWLCRDVLDTALPDGSADLVLCFNAFPHFADAAATAREIARWLRRGGLALVWHDIGRERLAVVHGGGPPPIRQDVLPPVTQLADLFIAEGLLVERAEEDEDAYMLLTRRPSGE
jgi:demethylmenaquinone methyltransferase/2-methoxy-6-polyprenyl-1,4-benzoquinol methylase